MAGWAFLTSHARALLCMAQDPGVRLRDIAASLGVTESSAYGIVTELAEAGYVVKQKDGRRNRYQIQAHLPLPAPARRDPAGTPAPRPAAGGRGAREPAPAGGGAAPVRLASGGPYRR